MKKLAFLTLLLPLAMCLSCSDKNDFPNVDMTLTLSGVTQSDGNFYTVRGEDVTIDKLEAKSLDGVNTGYANVVFYLNGEPLLGMPGDPFTGTFSTENLPAGQYTLGVGGNLLQEGSSIKTFVLGYPLFILDSEEDLPSNAPEIGTYSQTIRIGD